MIKIKIKNDEQEITVDNQMLNNDNFINISVKDENGEASVECFPLIELYEAFKVFINLRDSNLQSSE